MKFGAVITDSIAMKDFQNISTSLSKFAKECVMKITQRKLYFIISEEDSGPRKPLVWCELPVTFYFSDYTIVGVSETHNEIFLELSTVLLSRSLSVIKQNSDCLKLKLTNKESPCLTLEMDLKSGELSTRKVVHDIPVEVISRKHWSDYEEPRFTNFHVSIEMPSLKSIKHIVEHLKNWSPSLTVAANKNGRLTLKIQTNLLKVSSHFPDLNVESFAVGQIGNSDLDASELNEDQVSSTIDIKKFLMFLNGMQLNNCRTMCSIVHERMVKLFMEQPGDRKSVV